MAATLTSRHPKKAWELLAYQAQIKEGREELEAGRWVGPLPPAVLAGGPGQAEIYAGPI